MINKIVELKDGRTICRILDTIMSNGNTFYLVIEFDSGRIACINPKDICDILEYDEFGNFISIKDILEKSGI